MNDPFKVLCDECAVTLCWGDGKMGFRVDMSPQAARRLGHELIDKAETCEELENYELEQMR